MKILVVDTNTLFRQGLQSLLAKEAEVDVVGGAASCREAHALVAAQRPNVVLLELGLLNSGGSDCLQQLVARCPECQVIVMAAQYSDENLFAALRAGAQGFVLKNTSIAQLVGAIKGLEQGHLALSREMEKSVINEFARRQLRATEPPAAFDHLGRREMEVLKLMAVGASNQEIANRMEISEHTVNIHAISIQRKLGLQDRGELSSYVRRYGL
jgi:two-component system, NarL family, response regulator LiaR